MAILYEGRTFDAEKTKAALVEWIRDWFNKNGPKSVAVFGASGGKDSTTAGAILKEALGKDRVMAVLMPNDIQPDINDSYEVVKSLDIPYVEINIAAAYNGIIEQLQGANLDTTNSLMMQNLAPRLRMSTLYAVAQTMNGRVVNTCNLSETAVGWETKWGDQVGDFSPLGGLTVEEVIAIGKLYTNEIPERLVMKAPSDGLCGKTDEDGLGTKYAYIDFCVRHSREEAKIAIPEADFNRITELNLRSQNKRIISLPTFTNIKFVED